MTKPNREKQENWKDRDTTGVQGNDTSRDPWELEEPSYYSQDKFYPGGGRKEGEGIPHNIRWPSYTYRAIEMLVKSGDYPKLENFTDVCRDAVYHRLRYLKGKDPDTNSALRQLAVIEYTTQQERQHERFRKSISEAAAIIDDLDSLGYPSRSRRMLEEILTALAGIDDDFWVDVYLKGLENRIGRLFPVREIFQLIRDDSQE